MMLGKINAITLMSELFKVEEKVCKQQDEVLDRQIGVAMCPLRENLQNEYEKLDELEDIIMETLTKLDEFIKTME